MLARKNHSISFSNRNKQLSKNANDRKNRRLSLPIDAIGGYLCSKSFADIFQEIQRQKLCQTKLQCFEKPETWNKRSRFLGNCPSSQEMKSIVCFAEFIALCTLHNPSIDMWALAFQSSFPFWKRTQSLLTINYCLKESFLLALLF